MKKIIGIIFVSLMFANIGFAEMRVIEEKEIGLNFYHNFQTICIDRYKFVSVYKGMQSGQTHRSYAAVGLSLTQFFEERDGKSLPAKC